MIKTEEHIRIERVKRRKGSTGADLEKKTEKTRAGKMEKIYESFHPVIVENNEEGAEHAVELMWKHIQLHG